MDHDETAAGYVDNGPPEDDIVWADIRALEQGREAQVPPDDLEEAAQIMIADMQVSEAWDEQVGGPADDDPAWEILRARESAAESKVKELPIPTLELLEATARIMLARQDVTKTSVGEFRASLAVHFKLPPTGLDHLKSRIDAFLKHLVEQLLNNAKVHADAGDEEADDIGKEDATKVKRAYLVTLSHTDKSTGQGGFKLIAPGSLSRQEICDCMLTALARTQKSRVSPLLFQMMCIFQELHDSLEVHYHIAVLADRCFRFVTLKRELLETHGLASHWSCTHESYATCVAYGYVPTSKKPASDLDPQPLLWAPNGKPHPALSEASRAPITAKAMTQRRENERHRRSEEDKAERFKDVDLWPIVIRENIYDDESCAERVMAYAKRCGGAAMVDFCFRNWDKLPGLVARSWKVERVEEFVELASKTRIDLLRAACDSKCDCEGEWLAMARKVFKLNHIDEQQWRAAVVTSLAEGRAKGSLICHAGVEGNEGKSFLLKPLVLIYGDEGVFTAPPKNAFPLLDLERARLTLLDDWRFNEDIVSYGVQLLWFEGAPFVIARPQNQYSGHLRYTKNDPVFITTLQEDITSLKGKRFLKQGDIDMMMKRLLVFRFSRKIFISKKVAKGCACCFARLLLSEAPPGCISNSAAVAVEATGKRKAEYSTDDSPARKKSATWTVADVVAFLERLNLGHLAPTFQENGVDGQMLQGLSEEDLVKELGLKTLQAKKIIQRLGA
jgi:hypothetical protein